MSWLGSLIDLVGRVFDYATKGRRVELPPPPPPLPQKVVVEIEAARKRRDAQR